MAILIATARPLPDGWLPALEQALASEAVSVWPDTAGLAEIDCVVMAGPVPGLLRQMPRVRLIHTLGMGVDHILGDPDLPPGAVVCRVVDEGMTDQMAEYVTLAVLRVERESDRFDAHQRKEDWQRRFLVTKRRSVAVLGLGAVGRECARRLHFLGFPVLGWSRSASALEGIETFAGADGLAALLPRADIVVCALPLTEETKDLLNGNFLSQLPRGAHIINVGRGQHVVDNDLLAALDSGHLGGATLDVFRTEPLPPGHPFWRHDKVRVTPHSAGISSPAMAARRILENLARVRAGLTPLDQAFSDRGY